MPDGLRVLLGQRWAAIASLLLFILPLLDPMSTTVLVKALSLQHCPPSFQHTVKVYFSSQEKLFVDFILNCLLPGDEKRPLNLISKLFPYDSIGGGCLLERFFVKSCLCCVGLVGFVCLRAELLWNTFGA